MENAIFFIGDDPYILWDVDIKKCNLDFLKNFDTRYYDYLLELHLTSNDERRAAMSLRLTYHHALETLFSFLGALLQSPNFPNAWITQNRRVLNGVVRRISEQDQTLPTILYNKSISWESLAEVVFDRFSPGTDKQKKAIEGFSELWGMLAAEFLDKNRIDENNCIKHGFRVSSGGCALSVGVQKEKGVPCSTDQMTVLENSEFGTGFDRIQRISDEKNNRSLSITHFVLNWRVEKMTSLIRLISLSIQNIVGSLRIIGGESPVEVQFNVLTDPEDYTRPWVYRPVIPYVSTKFGCHDSIPKLSREDLLTCLRDSGFPGFSEYAPES